MITGDPSFLECRSHFRFFLTRTSDKNVIAMHRPRDGAQMIVKAARRALLSTHLPTMLQLGEFRTTPCAASQYALSGIRKVHSPATQQRCLSSLQRRNKLAERQTRLRQCLHSRPAELRVRSQLSLTPGQVSLRCAKTRASCFLCQH